jgi:hypothetical protein
MNNTTTRTDPQSPAPGGRGADQTPAPTATPRARRPVRHRALKQQVTAVALASLLGVFGIVAATSSGAGGDAGATAPSGVGTSVAIVRDVGSTPAGPAASTGAPAVRRGRTRQS